jgi:hypothetical protein
MPGRRQPVGSTPRNHADRNDTAWFVACRRTRRYAKCTSWTEARALVAYLEREYYSDTFVVHDAPPQGHREVRGFDWTIGSIGDLMSPRL